MCNIMQDAMSESPTQLQSGIAGRRPVIEGIT